MSRLFRVLLAMLAYGVVSGHCLNAKAETTTVTFQSSTYSDMRQILAREAPTGTVTSLVASVFLTKQRNAIPPLSLSTLSAGIATPTKAMWRQNCRRRTSLR